jgi:Sulfotransferase family
MLDTLGGMLSARFIERPIFIVGGSRSGTIVLLKAMGKHPEILITPSEDPFIVDIGNMVHRLEFVTEEERSAYLRSLRIPFDHIYASLRRLALESAMGPHFGLKNLTKTVVRDRTNVLRKRYWCTKTFPTEASAQGLLRLYPGTGFIWILRNGLNVVHSRTKFHAFRAMEFNEQCEHWAFTIKRFGYLFDMPEAVVVRQEDLLEDPEQVFRRIFEHLQMPYHRGPTDYARTTHVHPLDIRDTMKGVDVKKVLSERSPVHESWSEEQKNAFKRICGAAMLKANYDIPF